MEITFSKIFIILILIGVMIGSWTLGNSIKNAGAETVNFCKEHYRNKTFQSTMAGDEPAEPIQCQSKQWRTGWAQYCNKTCFENYKKCLKENATEEQVRFSRECQWFGKDWFSIMLPLLFKVVIPLFILFGIIGFYLSVRENISW